MSLPVETFSKGEIDLLARAVREWAGWRGGLTGHPDSEALKKFDRRIEHAVAVVAKLRRVAAQIDNLYTKP